MKVEEEYEKASELLAKRVEYVPPALRPYARAYSHLDGVANQFDGVNSDIHDENLVDKAFCLKTEIIEKALENHRDTIMSEAEF